MFSIIIPNYNSEKWISKCLFSILNQTYKKYEVIIVDDKSTDKSVEIIKGFVSDKIKLYQPKKKLYNGGARNYGVKKANNEYIVFIDCDDWLNSNNCLLELAKIVTLRKPDCVRLPYMAYTTKAKGRVMLREDTIEKLTESVFVAPWTKCIKRELFIPFPENTLIEDVVQHIAQMDVIESLECLSIPFAVWNRSNEDAISSTTRKYKRDDKRYSSIYRNLADLLDLRCKHDYCEKRRQFRINAYLDIIHNSKEEDIINGKF